jgi:dTMP kinase
LAGSFAVPEARGQFIALEGGEGAGKSTQARRLADWLTTRGIGAVFTREPGGAQGAERIRTLLLDRNTPLTPLTQTLLHVAARVEHVAMTIRPRLEAGTWVVCDRFMDSTRVYQGVAQGVDPAAIEALAGIVGIEPDLTLVLDVPVAVSRQRSASRGGAADRYEAMDDDVHQRIRDGFLARAASHPERYAVVDATGNVDAVFADLRAVVANRLG